MDLSTILGMVLAVTSISVGDILEGGNPLHVVHLSSFLIVMPTTAFCAMTSTHKKIVKAAYKELKVVFKGSGVSTRKDSPASQICYYCKTRWSFSVRIKNQ